MSAVRQLWDDDAAEDAAERFARSGDPADRERAVLAHARLAWSQARRYVDRGVELDELRQVAIVGLIKAVDRYDPSTGTPFVAYAVPTIRGELLRYLRDATWCAKVPRTVKELAVQVRRAGPQLVQRLGRSPTVAEIAEAVGARPDQVVEALEAWGGRRVADPEVGDDPEAISAAETERGYGEVEAAVTVDRLLSGVDDRTRELLELRYGHALTQQQIAERIGCSQVHVSRLLRRSLVQLRQVL